SAGIIAVNLNEGDELIGVDLTDGTNEVMLFSANGKVVRFPETDPALSSRYAPRQGRIDSPGTKSACISSFLIRCSPDNKQRRK
ncbi:DNA gyrase C-terminal beta-propeller domain-containing protein, partial [Serratia sp. ME43]|uniref:DNA gyrase C-terminal beta-propeller domain-containing protein n=1 Tax=Serratia sp. ME43 TaxID=2744256 RepID=UPI002103C7D5